MKKIVSAAIATSLLAGAAFAADAKITLNYRTKLDAFAYTKTDNGAGTEATTIEWLDWEGYEGAGEQSAANASDSFKIVLNGERAGATFAVNINENTKTSAVTTTETVKEHDYDSSDSGAEKNVSQKKVVTAVSSLFTLNEYSAWMKWELGPGELKVGSGNWKDGYADGAYRVKKDVDAQNAEGMDFERFKLGSILGKTWYLKSNKVTEGNANNSALFSYADYGFNVTDDFKLNILLGSVYNAFDTVTDDDGNPTYYDAFFVSRVQAKVNGVLDAELIYKKPSTKSNVFALYVMPKVMDQLTLNVGGALEMGNDTGKSGEDFTDWAFDLRARYQATDELSITFFTNLSGTNLDAGRVVSAGVTGRKGAWGWAAGAQNFDSDETLTGAPVKTAMWNNLSARYKVNDLLTATLNVGLITALSKIDGDDTSYGPEWRVTPAVQIYAASNASIWAGVALSGCKVEDLSTFNVDVPVIFRVKM